MPFVSPLTTHGLAVHAAVMPPGEEVTVYFEMTSPPVEVGAMKATEALALLAVTVVIVGAPGRPVGVTDDVDGADEVLVPTEFVAVMVNV
jgi:hypothetical protein